MANFYSARSAELRMDNKWEYHIIKGDSKKSWIRNLNISGLEGIRKGEGNWWRGGGRDGGALKGGEWIREDRWEGGGEWREDGRGHGGGVDMGISLGWWNRKKGRGMGGGRGREINPPPPPYLPSPFPPLPLPSPPPSSPIPYPLTSSSPPTSPPHPLFYILSLPG